MNMIKSLSVIGCAVLVVLAGCGKERQYKPVEQICIANPDKAAVMQAAQDVLNDMYFTIDKADTGEGYIRTHPLPGAQFFEFWRSDSVGSFNSAESNLHSIRRTAELNISRQNGQVCIGCNVKTQRLELLERKVSGSREMPGMFSRTKSSLQRLELENEQKKNMAWVDLGRDSQLETEILKRIEKSITTSKKESRQ